MALFEGIYNKTYQENSDFFKQYAYDKNTYWMQNPSNLIENYIYLYHLNQYIILPDYPEAISDVQSPRWSSSQPLLRTAPIQSYGGNDARKLSCQILWHRDMMNDINATNYSGIPSSIDFSSDEDYVDRAIKQLLAAQLPVYNSAKMQVQPPIVAMRLGDEIYIKGVLTGCGIQYMKPILRNNKYAQIQVSIEIVETEPYDAEMVLELGSFRCNTMANRNAYAFKYGTEQMMKK